MLAEFSIVPLGLGSSVGDKLAIALHIVDASGMPYKVNPMGTVVEGDWDEIMALVKKCRDELMKTEDRLLISIKIDDRKGRRNRIEEKVASVEKRLGRELRK
ncbi:MAG TPA: MTH1187 family thiamine-binding protein [Dissulfurispiraceae bacterium]|nr:MTH1187 family thiamine-binding protein [Dissulfurispiraceae bacterium]